MNQTVVDALFWIGLTGAAAAVVIYFLQIAMRPQAIRLINGAGLFFTGLALAGMTLQLRQMADAAGWLGVLTTLALLVAVYFQGAASLRGRKGDRRGDRRDPPAP